jgi:hypothetical protein
MDKVQKHNSFNTNAPSSESYKNESSLCNFVKEVDRLKCVYSGIKSP